MVSHLPSRVEGHKKLLSEGRGGAESPLHLSLNAPVSNLLISADPLQFIDVGAVLGGF